MKKEPEFKFDLGDEVEDMITGFSGIIVCRCQWIYNCNTYGLMNKILNDGKPRDREYFDEPQLKLIEIKKIEKKRDTGGPCGSVLQTNR